MSHISQIYYKSTRGDARAVSSAEAILKGVAADGGLFVPVPVPKLGQCAFAVPAPVLASAPADAERAVASSVLGEQVAAGGGLSSSNYRETALRVAKAFFTDFKESELRECIDSAYDKKFALTEIAPLVKPKRMKQVQVYFLELYHGPTMAFKDMALSLLPHLMKTAAKKMGMVNDMVILTATSGDTGKAALEGFAGVEGVKVIVFFPEHGVSEIQKRLMVTQEGDNVHVIGIKGNFDDAQSGVKEIFADAALREKAAAHNFVFSSANSINIGRLIPQVAYYFYAYQQLCDTREIVAGEEINFVVPTGNFGNILAGYYAKKMGLPVKKLICASNENKVLCDFLNTGRYDKKRDFVTTMSPSMDILISSNLERLLYMLSGEDAAKVREMLQGLCDRGEHKVTDRMLEMLRKDFFGGYASDEETAESIREVFDLADHLIDPHTAVAYAVYKKYCAQTKDTAKTVIVSTASPYKFTKAVMSSLDKKYAAVDDYKLVVDMSRITSSPVPQAIKDLETKPVLHRRVCKKEEMKAEVERTLGL